VTYNASIKVLSISNKKDFTVYTLGDLSVEDFLIPDALREEVFCQLGQKVVSRNIDFHIGYFSSRHNVKNWINSNQDAKDACEMLKKA